MEITATLYATTRREWRRWLEANHEREHEVWPLSPFVHSEAQLRRTNRYLAWGAVRRGPLFLLHSSTLTTT